MEYSTRSGLVGGIAQVVLHHPSSTLPHLGGVARDSLTLSLLSTGSSYSESRVDDGDLTATEHTLTLAIEPDSPIFDDRAMERAVSNGVVADITLSTGVQIRVGWSERYGVAFPLLFTSVGYDSGSQISDKPTRKWVLSSVDTVSNL
ncbi:MAG: hypothetical protein SNG35_01810 [Rikenellaceae bacterium]